MAKGGLAHHIWSGKLMGVRGKWWVLVGGGGLAAWALLGNAASGAAGYSGPLQPPAGSLSDIYSASGAGAYAPPPAYTPASASAPATAAGGGGTTSAADIAQVSTLPAPRPTPNFGTLRPQAIPFVAQLQALDVTTQAVVTGVSNAPLSAAQVTALQKAQGGQALAPWQVRFLESGGTSTVPAAPGTPGSVPMRQLPDGRWVAA